MSPADVPRITVEELKDLMDSGADIAILDNRPRASFDEGHIKGAVSLPWAMQIDEEYLAVLPWAELTITYCDCGPGEADSADVAVQLIEMGVAENVKVLADPAIAGWIEAGYPIE